MYWTLPINVAQEFAVQIHMAHLLCLLARGRMVSQASDDSLLQVSITGFVQAEWNSFSDLELSLEIYWEAKSYRAFQYHWFQEINKRTTELAKASFVKFRFYDLYAGIMSMELQCCFSKWFSGSPMLYLWNLSAGFDRLLLFLCCPHVSFHLLIPTEWQLNV
jgi:hypothetical protein